MYNNLTEDEKIYLLGFGFHEFDKIKEKIIIKKPTKYYIKSLKELSIRLYNQSRVYGYDSFNTALPLEDKDIVKFLMENGVFSPKRYIPNLSNSKKLIFASGYFDGYGIVNCDKEYPTIQVLNKSKEISGLFGELFNLNEGRASGYKSLDVLTTLAENGQFESDKYDLFWKIINKRLISCNKHQKIKYKLLSPKAVPPIKSYGTDSGYDLHIVQLTKLYNTPFGAEVYKGKTEIAMQPPLGSAFDIAGRSSLPEKGWQFMQGIGVHDRGYIGPISAHFMKLKNDPLPEMPWKALQIKTVDAPFHFNTESVDSFEDSCRASGGFGSTDLVKKN